METSGKKCRTTLSFSHGNVNVCLRDTVFVANTNVPDFLNLDNAIVGYVRDIIVDEHSNSAQVSILKFLRPRTLPPNIEVEELNLHPQYELILDDREDTHPEEYAVERVLHVCKIKRCSSPSHIPKGSKFPFFCRFALKESGSSLSPINSFRAVQRGIGFEICLKEACKPHEETVMAEKEIHSEPSTKQCSVLVEKVQNSSLCTTQGKTESVTKRKCVESQSKTSKKNVCQNEDNCPPGTPRKQRKCSGSILCTEASSDVKETSTFHGAAESVHIDYTSNVSVLDASPTRNEAGCNEGAESLESHSSKETANNSLRRSVRARSSPRKFWRDQGDLEKSRDQAGEVDQVDRSQKKSVVNRTNAVRRSNRPINTPPRYCETSDDDRPVSQQKKSTSVVTGQPLNCEEQRSPSSSVTSIINQTNAVRRSKRPKNTLPQYYEVNDDDRPVSQQMKRKSVVTCQPLNCEEQRSPLSSETSIFTHKSAGRKRRQATPSMPHRSNTLEVSESSLESVRAKLHVSAVPVALPCRETEFQNIYRFLEDKICDASGGCMYISGVPGTGKTATVHAVIRCLQEKMKMKQLREFQFIEVNGLRLTEPRQVFVQLLQHLTGKKCTPHHARDLLSKMFASNSRSNKTVVLLVDEVDMLLNNRQDVIYNLFEWPNHAYSHLIVLTIANTMDLPERLFMGRVTSRLGLTRLAFRAYTHQQLQTIVMSRLEGTDAFCADAVQLVARKVAAISGDARRALDICRRATELVAESGGVTMKTIELAFNQMLNAPNVKAIKACTRLEKHFLKAVVIEKERTGVEETNFLSVYRQFKDLCYIERGSTPNVTQAMMILGRLGSSRLLITEHARSALHQSIYLNISPDDIHYAFTGGASET